ncbi:MAG: polysaccharide biosynthesis/export family protein [Verrucomicrobia bacterium]|nr:polysaccharide biosynthesis/export family protein [Verrucomicrobiota bacterium]
MKNTGIIFALLLIFVLAGCSGPAAFDRTSAGDENALVGLYKLRALDPLIVTLLGIPQEKQIDTVIDEKGNITLPYIDEPVKAVGRTTSELEREIQRIYTDSGIYRNITVNIQTSAKSYYMEGEISRPQEYPLNRRITLLQAIAAASGYTEYANPKRVTITRNGQIITFNADRIEKHPELDVPVESGDRIKVYRSFF